ncbi:MAG: hypothetical protein AABZ60_04690 [Planctomycetota bacterium]
MFDFREWKLRRIAKRLSYFELQEPEPGDLELTEETIKNQLITHTEPDLFLNFYTRKGIENALKEYGIWDRLLQLGFAPHLTIRPLDERVHLLRITDTDKGPVLMEMQSRLAVIRAIRPVGFVREGDLFELLGVEWLMMQHPKKSFTQERPKLPGQEYPGLNLGREIMILLRIMAERLKLEGVLGFPLYYHNAFLYNARFRFFSPRREGELMALQRDLKPLGLATASWALKYGFIFSGLTKEPYTWKSEEMIWPLSDRVIGYFADKKYQDEMRKNFQETQFYYEKDQILDLLKKLSQN